MDKQVIRVADAAEILALIPHQLGFVPKNSAVVVSLRGERRRVGLVARMNLDEYFDAIGRLATHLRDDGATDVSLVLYVDEDDDDSQFVGYFEELENNVMVYGIDVGFSPYVVTPTHYRRIRTAECDGQCEFRHQPQPIEKLSMTQTGMVMAMSGSAPLADREQIGALPEFSAVDLREAAGGLQTWLDQTDGDPLTDLQVWFDVMDGDGVTPEQGAILGALLTAAPLVRDAVLVDLIAGHEVARNSLDRKGLTGAALNSVFTPGSPAPDAEALARAVSRLEEVVAYSEDAGKVGALSLLGFLGWWSGNGVVAAVRLGQALVILPDYNFALLLTATVENSLPPGWVR